MSVLPENYVISKFYELAGYVSHNKHNDTYNACCPICREGNSWGKKKRCFYIPKHDNIYCHNCGWSSNPLKWIQYLTNKTPKEIFQESESDEYLTSFTPTILDSNENIDNNENKELPSLPGDCINLFDINQIKFYKGEQNLLLALSYIYSRKLPSAINKPPALYLCKNDLIHKNRIIIPFFDENNEIVYYQSRGILPDDLKNKPKYLSKLGGEKSIFGINNINNNIDNVYIFEGPIDSMFVKNGIAVGGIQDNTTKNFNPKQQEQMQTLSLFNKIWCLDSQYIDNAALKKSEILVNEGETIFIWPEELGTIYKDFNEICSQPKSKKDINEIPYNWINKHSYSGLQALQKLTAIKKFIKKSV